MQRPMASDNISAQKNSKKESSGPHSVTQSIEACFSLPASDRLVREILKRGTCSHSVIPWERQHLCSCLFSVDREHLLK